MTRDPASAWQRYKSGSGPLHELTEKIAKAIHESHYDQSWEIAREADTWLAVGSWIDAEVVIKVLPFNVPLDERRT